MLPLQTALMVCALGGALLPAKDASSQSYQSNKYPADLHPSLCPHYPYCDNAALGGFARSVAAIRGGDAHAPGYPASLSPHACPNYPYCSHRVPPEALHYRRASSHEDASSALHYALRRSASASASAPLARYPSGVDPAACPNYPYCHR